MLVLYDGSCGLCDHIVQFLLTHDMHNRFFFAALQSDIGLFYKRRYGIAHDVDSVVVIEQERAYTYSDAALQLAKHLPLRYRPALLSYIVPRRIRDAAYRQVAKRRLQIFGTVDACRLPTMAERKKFLA